MTDPRIIVALDVPTRAEAEALVEQLGDAISFYKIGLQLMATDGMAMARDLKGRGRQVFADNTGGQTCSSSRGSTPSQTSSHRSKNPRNRRISSSTGTAPRFVRALSAPTSITSAPAIT